MIHVSNTPNNTGAAIHGDFMDFEQLYDALHTIVGDEGEHPRYESVRIRVLGFCHDLRHALMGDHEFEFVDNGMDEDKMRRLAVIAPSKNIYLSFHVLWPEMLLVTMALNDFVLLNNKTDKRSQWDKPTAVVRMLQAAVAECIKQTVSEASYKRMLNMMIRPYTWFDGFTTQYLDILNSRFLAMDKEKRLKSISTMTKRLTERGQEYVDVKRQVSAAAREYGCAVDDVEINLDFPEDIEW